MAVSGFIEDLVPGFQYVWESKKFRRGKELVRELFEIYIGTKLREHKRTFDKGTLKYSYTNLIGVCVSRLLTVFNRVQVGQ